MSKKTLELGTPPGAVPELARDGHEEEAPTGTLFFMMIILLLMVALWGSVYWVLLER